MREFVHDVRRVDPQATGNPLQAYECSLEMKRSYEQATLFSLIVIFGVLYFDFRNLTHCALAAIPQFMGIAITLGLLGYMNTPLNPANLIAVPMILGIGVDYSVYIVHEWLEQKGRYRMTPGTAIAVTVDATDHAHRLRQPADCQPPRIAKPGSRADDCGDVLHAHVGHRAAGVSDLDHAQTAARPVGRRRGGKLRSRRGYGVGRWRFL